LRGSEATEASLRGSEATEAIHIWLADCFATLAMTDHQIIKSSNQQINKPVCWRAGHQIFKSVNKQMLNYKY